MNFCIEKRKVLLLGAFIGSLMVSLYATLTFQGNDLLEAETVLEPISVFPDFASISDVSVKKQMFFDFIEIYINQENQKVLAARERIQTFAKLLADGSALSPEESEELAAFVSHYEIADTDRHHSEVIFELLKRVDTIPSSLALAQAANESAWGTSRFALEANNIFGQWCYDEGCGVVPDRRVSGASHEVRSFATVEEAVRAYFLNLNTHDQYEDFRKMRFQMRNQRGTLDPLVLAYGLSGYSERGEHYVDEVQTIIQQNDLINRYSI